MSDKTIRTQILDELEWEPRVDPTHIGVAVEDGIVTLTGHVNSYAAKAAVENVVKHIGGVRAIAQELEVRLPGDKQTADDQIAKRALDVIAWNSTIPKNKVQVKVQHGVVTLTGEVDWHYQKDDAEDAVRKLSGIKGMINSIQIKPKASAPDVKRRIEEALKRNAKVEADSVSVSAVNGQVTLNGKVRTYFERDLIERTAWSAPGVTMVNDLISIG